MNAVICCLVELAITVWYIDIYLPMGI